MSKSNKSDQIRQLREQNAVASKRVRPNAKVHVEDPNPDEGMELEEAVVEAVAQVKARGGKKQLSVWIDEELMKKLKIEAIETDTTIELNVACALESWLGVAE